MSHTEPRHGIEGGSPATPLLHARTPDLGASPEAFRAVEERLALAETALETERRSRCRSPLQVKRLNLTLTLIGWEAGGTERPGSSGGTASLCDEPIPLASESALFSDDRPD